MTMDRSDLSGALQEAGLTEYQADAYLTLLDQGTSPAVDVARHCSVPAPRIYDVLKALEQQGFVETLQRETLHARPRDPSEVIDQLQDKSTLLSVAAEEIEDRWEQTPLGDNELNMTKRADTVVEHATQIIREAEHTIDVSVDPEQLEALTDALEDVDFDDVIVRVSLFDDPENPQALAGVTIPDVVTEVRTRNISAPFLVIVDRTQVCFAPTARLPNPYGLVVNDEIVSFVFQWYFETCEWVIWEQHHRRERPRPEYVNLEAFVLDAYPRWQDGDDIEITVHGIDTRTGDARTISGTLEDIEYTGQDAGSPPTLIDLAGEVNVTLSTDEGSVKIGSWAARREDLEARRIELVSGTLERHSA